MICIIKKYLTEDACTTNSKTMVLALIEYGDMIYEGTSQCNLNKLSTLFYRGLRICITTNNKVGKIYSCNECHISP